MSRARATRRTPGTTSSDRTRLLRDRICFVCRRPTAERSVFHADLMILTHDGSCAERVRSLRRINDRSARGRWRPARQLLQLLDEQGARR